MGSSVFKDAALGKIAILMVPLALTLRTVNRSADAKPAQ
jgi:hypothetical protein